MAGALLDAIRAIVAPPSEAAAPDGDLLERFVSRGDQTAFTALVKRHGPMVLGVCRRMLHDDRNGAWATLPVDRLRRRDSGAVCGDHLR